MRKYVPSYSGTLRSHGLTLPHCISECSGIRIFGKRIKSIAFSTDAAIIKNINADAIIAVYPFTPQASISQAVINVICNYRGNIVGGKRIMKLIGLDLGQNRVPFRNMTDEEEASMKRELEQIGFFERCNRF